MGINGRRSVLTESTLFGLRPTRTIINGPAWCTVGLFFNVERPLRRPLRWPLTDCLLWMIVFLLLKPIQNQAEWTESAASLLSGD